MAIDLAHSCTRIRMGYLPWGLYGILISPLAMLTTATGGLLKYGLFNLMNAVRWIFG